MQQQIKKNLMVNVFNIPLHLHGTIKKLKIILNEYQIINCYAIIQLGNWA